MKRSFQLKVVAAAVLMASSMAQAGSAFLNGTPITGDGSIDNPYLMGVIGASPATLFVSLGGPSNMFFFESADFTIPTTSTVSGVANTYSLTFGATNLIDISGLTIDVWNNSHPNGTFLSSSFLGNNSTTDIGLLSAGSYHIDISGYLGPNAVGGQSSVALQALPVPEPETYVMLLAGLGLVGFSLRRRET